MTVGCSRAMAVGCSGLGATAQCSLAAVDSGLRLRPLAAVDSGYGYGCWLHWTQATAQCPLGSTSGLQQLEGKELLNQHLLEPLNLGTAATVQL